MDKQNHEFKLFQRVRQHGGELANFLLDLLCDNINFYMRREVVLSVLACGSPTALAQNAAQPIERSASAIRESWLATRRAQQPPSSLLKLGLIDFNLSSRLLPFPILPRA